MKPLPHKAYNLWVSPHGEIEVPDFISIGIRFTKQGFPDKRSPQKSKGFMEFIREAEAKLKRKYIND